MNSINSTEMNQSETSLFLNIHLLQTLPPGVSNRDDLGNPKSAVYGGATRARVSSQAWKKVIRDKMHELSKKTTYRTAMIPQRLYTDMLAAGMDPSAALIKVGEVFSDGKTAGKLLVDGAKILKAGVVSAPLSTNISIFIAEEEYQGILASCTEGSTVDVGEILKSGKTRFGGIISLFGRMMADLPSMNVEAASSFAHAITTHEAEFESDYFTLCDDKALTTGAGHLGQTSFTSGVFYRNIVLDIGTLGSNMVGFSEEEIKELAAFFMTACLEAFPEGKKNSMYCRTIPTYALVDLTNLPISLAGAFEAPIKSDGTGYMEPSINALEEHRGKMQAQGYTVKDSCGGRVFTHKDLAEFVHKHV